MFVIPAAGPGDIQVPVMFVLDGVVSEGPQEASASTKRLGSRKLAVRMAIQMMGCLGKVREYQSKELPAVQLSRKKVSAQDYRELRDQGS
jgi:hypothetical protein